MNQWFRLLTLAFLSLAAQAQQREGSFVASRYDDVHVIFIAASDEAMSSPSGRTPTLAEPVAQFARAGPLFEIGPEEIVKLKLDRPMRVRAGDRYELLTGTGAGIPATIERLVVQETCSGKLIGAIARIDDADRSRYRQLRAKYYLIRSVRPENPAALPAPLPGRIQIGAGERTRLEGLLNDAMLAALKKVTYDPAERNPSVIRGWRAVDAALAKGDGRLKYDVQTVFLGPKNGLRFYVKALWVWNGAPAFRLSAWIRPGDPMKLEQVQEVLRARISDLPDVPQDLEALPKLLNVIVLDNGRALVLISSYGAESVELLFLEYDGKKFERSEISFGYGC